MIKYGFLIFGCFLTLVYAERSVFGAGDLNSPAPYGLTPAEKVIIKNKQILSKNQKKINKVDSSLKELYERIDGLESVSTGDSQKVHKAILSLNKLKTEFKNFQADISLEMEKKDAKIQNLENKIALLTSNIEQNNKNITLLQTSLEKATAIINTINESFVTRKDFKNLLTEIDKTNKKTYRTKSKSISNSSSKKYTKSKKLLIQDARKLFKKSYFTKALPILEYLIKTNYRPAECNYYVGEIKYYRKKYSDALYFYKTSMMLYDRAKYLPRLLLHSAIAFEKTKDYAQAKNFYSTLIEVYPDSSEAKKASKKIKKLK